MRLSELIAAVERLERERDEARTALDRLNAVKWDSDG